MNFPHLDEVKQHLNKYIDALHTPIAPLNKTAHFIHGELSKLIEVPEFIFEIRGIKLIEPAKLKEIQDYIERLRPFIKVLKESEDNLWKGSEVKKYNFDLQTNVNVRFKRLSASFTFQFKKH